MPAGKQQGIISSNAKAPRGISIEKQNVQRQKPRGRPPALYRDKLILQGTRSRNLMERVVRDAGHPWHNDWAPKFVVELARMGTPRLTAIEGKDGASLKMIDVASMIYADAVEADYVEVDVSDTEQLALED